MTTAKFEKQRFGVTVAQIHETDYAAVEVQARNDGKFVLTIHNRRGDTNLWDDMSVTLEPKHFQMLGSIADQRPMSEKRSDLSDAHLGLLDDMDHEAKWDTDAEYRKSELRIQALGAAISRRDWDAVEQAHAAIRDKFYAHTVSRPHKPDMGQDEENQNGKQ